MEKPLKILLVYPPTMGGVQSMFTHHKDEGIGFKPPLGILTLATYLRRNGFPDTHCLDANLEQLSPEETAERIAAEKPDVVGLTVWTDFWYPAHRTMAEVRRALPQATIVMGGPHCSIYPEVGLENSEADYLVAGDGEEPMLALAQTLRTGAPVGDVPGVWVKRDGRAVAPSVRIATISDAAIIPSPDRTLLPYKRYSSILGHGEYETTLMTSRGCPHRCVFCKMHSQHISARPAESIVDEFREIAELGIKDIQVYDDTFTWSKKRVMDICRGILDSGIDVRWAIRDRVSKADAEMYAMLRRAGCYRIHFGVETGSPRILHECGKGITHEQALDAIRLAKAAGMETMAFFMFGFIGETAEDAQMTIDFANRLDADYAVFMSLIPYPGTAIYESALETGLIGNDFWAEFVRNPSPDFVIPTLIEDILSREEIVGFKTRAQRGYYLRPKVVLRELMKVKSPKELFKRAGMAARILFEGN